MKHCPKCNREVAPAAAICPHCGIVFAKYYKYHADPQAPATPRPQATVMIDPAPDSLLGGDAYRDNSAVFLGRCLLLPGFVLWSWLLIAPGIAANAAAECFCIWSTCRFTKPATSSSARSANSSPRWAARLANC